MSGDLQALPADTRAAQQRACDRWRKEFNEVRPHEALQQRVPAELYVASPRRPREKIAIYPSSWLTRLVSVGGLIKIEGDAYRVSDALKGHRVGLQPLDGLRWRVWFYDLDLGELEVVPSDLPLRKRLETSPHRGRSSLQ